MTFVKNKSGAPRDPEFFVFTEVTVSGRVFREKYMPVPSGDARADFWGGIAVISNRHLTQYDADHLEQEFISTFPEALRKYVLSDERVQRFSEELREALIFKVRVVVYGSMLFAISAANWDLISKAFENNFGIFASLIEPFVRPAFEDLYAIPESSLLSFVIPDRPAGVPEREISTPLKAAFQRLVPPTDAEKTREAFSPTASARLRMWRIAQSTLLLPVLLCVLIWYFGTGYFSSSLSEERQALSRQSESLARERTALLDLSKSQIAALTGQNGELARALAQKPMATCATFPSCGLGRCFTDTNDPSTRYSPPHRPARCSSK